MARRGLHDETLPASMTLSVRRASEADAPLDPPRWLDVVVLPVTIAIPLTAELKAKLAGRSFGPK